MRIRSLCRSLGTQCPYFTGDWGSISRSRKPVWAVSSIEGSNPSLSAPQPVFPGLSRDNTGSRTDTVGRARGSTQASVSPRPQAPHRNGNPGGGECPQQQADGHQRPPGPVLMRHEHYLHHEPPRRTAAASVSASAARSASLKCGAPSRADAPCRAWSRGSRRWRGSELLKRVEQWAIRDRDR
jgi:hypothetical protein